MSLAEVLLVIGIVAILAAVSFVAVFRYQRSMHQLEMDGIAKEIFVAAQNHLSAAEEQAYLSNSSFGSPDTVEPDKGIYYFIVGDTGAGYTDPNGDTVLSLMLPFGSVDETVRLGGSYIVRYQKYPAQVLDVFAMKGYGCEDNYQRLARCEELAERKNCTVAQIAMAWVYSQPMNTFAIASMSSPARIQENIAALSLKLTDDECRYLNLETDS